MIRLEAVSKIYRDGSAAVQALSMEIQAGELAVLVGPSGCGKTTTMRMINRLVDPTSGRVLIAGEDIAGKDPVQLRRTIGYVIQQVGLLPHQSVRKNVATVPKLLGWDSRRSRTRVDELLELVGLEPSVFGDRYPHQLSGGQRQRVGVARALAVDPPILLMDEPFGAVDPLERGRLQDEMLKLLADAQKTVVFVTHDVDEAIRLGTRIAVMRQGGHLEQFAPPSEILAHPATPFVADFVGNDRTVKLLSVSQVSSQVLEQAESIDERSPQIEGSASLRDALALLLRSETGRIRVGTDGVLTMEGIRRSLRELDGQLD